jgi:hypothetical protein
MLIEIYVQMIQSQNTLQLIYSIFDVILKIRKLTDNEYLVEEAWGYYACHEKISSSNTNYQ